MLRARLLDQSHTVGEEELTQIKKLGTFLLAIVAVIVMLFTALGAAILSTLLMFYVIVQVLN